MRSIRRTEALCAYRSASPIFLSVKPPFPLLFYNAYGTKHTHFIKQTATCQLNLLFIGLFVHSVFYLPVHNLSLIHI